MHDYQTLSDLTEEYFTRHPEEIDDFLQESFAEYAKDGDSAALLSQLRVIARVKGISAIADEVGMTRQGVQKALSGKGNPRLDSINAIMQALGYQLMPKKLDLFRGSVPVSEPQDFDAIRREAIDRGAYRTQSHDE